LHNFADFGLLPPILDALANEGYTTPTPIQSQAIPFVLSGRDLCGIAQTGTGKTAAFALPILHRLAVRNGPPARGTCRVLVLTPTRELASQIADSFRTYGGRLPLSTTVVFGGVPLGAQQRRLASGVDILVATPGRLLDLIDRGALTLSKVEILVLDEADRMLDLGFIHALKRIVKLLPGKRQTLLFSATMPPAIAELAVAYLHEPVKVSVAPAATTAERVEQGVMFVPPERKRDLLATMLRDPGFERVLVFTRTKHGADRVARHLCSSGVEAAAIHGNKSQPQRERALAGFRSGIGRVLVATDIAARGIDVENVTHVINFELPNVPEDYVHRIGRTARAGATGIAIAFCSDEEKPYLRSIEKLTRLSVPVLPTPAAAQHAPTPLRQPAEITRSARSDAHVTPKEPNHHAAAKPKSETANAGSPSLPAFVRRLPAAKRASPIHPVSHRGKRRIAN
jgi:ATP-dependent RNA helicase RhlE